MEDMALAGFGEVLDNAGRNYIGRTGAKVNKLLHNIFYARELRYLCGKDKNIYNLYLL